MDYDVLQIGESAAFIRSDDPSLFPPSEYPPSQGLTEDSTSGLDAPDLEVIASPFAWTEHGAGRVPDGDLCSLGIILIRLV